MDRTMPEVAGLFKKIRSLTPNYFSCKADSMLLKFVYTQTRKADMATETMLQYVVRKLNDKAYNCAELCRRTGLKKSTISEIASGKSTDPQHSTVERIHQYFKSLAE